MHRIFFLAAVLACSTARAQTHFGLRVGWSQSTLDSDELVAMGGQLNGYHFGGAFSVGDPGDHGLTLELLLSKRGALDVSTDLYQYGLPDEPNADHSLTYLDLPLMFRIGLFVDGLYAEAGFYAAFLLSTKISGTGVTDMQADRIADGYKGTQFGFMSGLGYVHSSGIGVSVRGSISLGNTYEGVLPAPPVYTNELNSKTYFTVLQVGLLYYFNVERW